MYKAIKHDFIIEYKRANDREWRRFCTAKDGEEARQHFERLKPVPHIHQIRVRREVVQSQTIDEWEKEDENGRS